MQLNITARHLDLTPALSDYVRRKVEKAQRYLDIIWAQAILAVEKHRHIAEIVVHTAGDTFRTQGEAGDLYSAVDLAAHKLDLHLSRVKDKKRDHRKSRSAKALAVAAPPPLPTDAEAAAPALPAIAEIKKISLEEKSLSQAIRELNSDGLPFVLFINERNSQISLVYKKGKGTYGLVEAAE